VTNPVRDKYKFYDTTFKIRTFLAPSGTSLNLKPLYPGLGGGEAKGLGWNIEKALARS